MYPNRYARPVLDTVPAVGALTSPSGRETMGLPKAESAPPERIQLCRRTRRQKGFRRDEEESIRDAGLGTHLYSVGDAGIAARATEHLAGRDGQGRGQAAVHELLGPGARHHRRDDRGHLPSRWTGRLLDDRSFGRQYIVELVDQKNKIVCTEGPFDMSQSPIKSDVIVDCNKKVVTTSLIAAALAAGFTAGAVVGGGDSAAPAAVSPAGCPVLGSGQRRALRRFTGLGSTLSSRTSGCASADTRPPTRSLRTPTSFQLVSMRFPSRVIALALVCLGGAASTTHAQDDVDPAEAARFRIGALRFTPSIAVSSLGIDSNVFNQAENPRQDSTAAVGPAVDLWLRGGRSYLSGKASGQYPVLQRIRQPALVEQHARRPLGDASHANDAVRDWQRERYERAARLRNRLARQAS